MLQHLLDFSFFHHLCGHLSPAWSLIAMYEKPVLLHTTGLEIAGYIDTHTHRIHFKPHQAHQGADLYHVAPPSISVDPRRKPTKVAAEFTRRLEPAALAWWTAATAWRTQRAAHHARLADYATMLTTIGHGQPLPNHPNPVIVSAGPHNWRATLHDDGTVTLELRRLPFEDAADILEKLR